MSLISDEPICYVADTGDASRSDTDQPTPASSLEELERFLRECATREPRIVQVYMTDALMLWAGLGGDFAAVTVYPIPNAPEAVRPHWTAWAGRRYTTECRAFINYLVPFEFEAEAMMPQEEVIQIIMHFVQHRELPESYLWGPPGPNQYRWGAGGTREEWKARCQQLALPNNFPF